MNRIQGIVIEHMYPFEQVHIDFARRTSAGCYVGVSRFSLNRLEEIINALTDQGEGRLELKLSPTSVEVTYILPVDYYDGLLELSELLG